MRRPPPWAVVASWSVLSGALLFSARAFHLANLAVESSEARIPGFNSAGMTQYLNRGTPTSRG